MNSESNNHIGFRLPDDQLQELNRLAQEHGKSKGRLARQMVTAALLDFSRFDELAHSLGNIQRALTHLEQRLDRLETVALGLDQLRAALATATTRLLVENGHVEVEEAIAWTMEAFGVEEQK